MDMMSRSKRIKLTRFNHENKEYLAVYFSYVAGGAQAHIVSENGDVLPGPRLSFEQMKDLGDTPIVEFKLRELFPVRPTQVIYTETGILTFPELNEVHEDGVRAMYEDIATGAEQDGVPLPDVDELIFWVLANGKGGLCFRYMPKDGARVVNNFAGVTFAWLSQSWVESSDSIPAWLKDPH